MEKPYGYEEFLKELKREGLTKEQFLVTYKNFYKIKPLLGWYDIFHYVKYMETEIKEIPCTHYITNQNLMEPK